ncbi:MAG: TonB-dependent receptor [Bacteroidales bacterium]|jgi:iron complex outermembrane receptor protein|nr:TonB-dependent receptor [Bacteroidales bacterium]MDD4214880.1 TonB-dependent receptor [Bacteroidales bacterium]
MRKVFFFTFFTLIFSINTFCQTDTLFIKEVLIHADKIAFIDPGGIRNVQVIQAEDISKLPVATLPELLNYLTATDIRSRGANEVQADVSIDGGSFEQTLILLNGIRVNNPQTGHHNLDIPIEISKVKRIEIMKGSGARLFGPGAFSGVINIITSDYDESFVSVSASGGMYGLIDGNISSNINSKNSNNFFSFNYKQCLGYTTNTDFNVWKGFYRGSFKFKNSSFALQAGYQDKAFGANSFYSFKYPEQYEKTKSGLMAITYSYSKKTNLIINGYLQLHHDRFQLFREDAPVWYINHNYHLTEVKGGSVEMSFYPILGKTNIRGEFYNEIINSNVLGETTSDTIKDIWDKNGFFTNKSSRNTFNVSINQTLSKKRTSFTFGILLNYNNKFGFDFCPGFDFMANISPKLKVFFSANKSLRAPSFTELYYQSPVNRANPELMSEKAYQAEGGLNYKNKGLQINITGFYRYGKNIIDWVKEPDSSIWESSNITELHTWGAEAIININFEDFNIKKCFLQTLRLSYSYIDSYKKSGDLISYYVMDYLKHKLTLSTDVKIYKSLGFNLTLLLQDRNGSYTDFATGGEKSYAVFLVGDAKVFWRPLNFDIFVACNNIFNTRYYDFGNIQMPGAWVTGGIRYLFNFKTKNHGN